jgi:autoinducer 2 (AI-2) kinase
VSDPEIRELVVRVARELFAAGYLTATGGNVSARASEEGTLWVTPTRLFKGEITETDLVRIRDDGSVVEGDRVPTREWRMHWASYRARPESRGAVHTHSPYATAFAISAQRFPPIHPDAVLLRDIPTVPWILPGSPELAEAVAQALKRASACLLRNHGVMAIGPTLREAAVQTMRIEEAAKLVCYCRQFGGPIHRIPQEWIDRLEKFY